MSAQPKTLEMQPALFDAAIDVLNGLSLMDAFRKYHKDITVAASKSPSKAANSGDYCTESGKDSKGCIDPRYGVIRHSVMRVCAFRNKAMFEKLRDRDANKPKEGKKTASDVSYETLQLFAHHFLTPDEMARFESNLHGEIEAVDVLSESKESYLLAQQRVMTSRIRRIERSMRETGIVRDGAIIEVQELLARLAAVDARLLENMERMREVVAITKAGKRHQSAVRSAACEGRKRG